MTPHDADQVIRDLTKNTGMSLVCPMEGRCLTAAPNVDGWFVRFGLMFEVPGIDGVTSRPLAELRVTGAELHDADEVTLRAIVIERMRSAKASLVAMLRSAADELEATR